MYCTNCGNKIKDKEIYCTNCGEKLKKDNNLNRQSSKNNYDVLSLIFAIVAIIFFWHPIISIPLAITSIIFANNHKKETGIKVPGLIISIISLILSILVIIFIVISIIFSSRIIDTIIKYVETNFEYYEEENEYNNEYNNEQVEKYDIQGYSWTGDDKSVLYLENNKKYSWYQDDTIHTDNYHLGTYSYYKGKDAINYIAMNLPQYGLTKEEQYKLFEDDNYSIDDYYLIILNSNEVVMDGVEQSTNTNAIYYYGFYTRLSDRLDLVNMNSGNKAGFIRREKIKNIDI